MKRVPAAAAPVDRRAWRRLVLALGAGLFGAALAQLSCPPGIATGGRSASPFPSIHVPQELHR